MHIPFAASFVGIWPAGSGTGGGYESRPGIESRPPGAPNQRASCRRAGFRFVEAVAASTARLATRTPVPAHICPPEGPPVANSKFSLPFNVSDRCERARGAVELVMSDRKEVPDTKADDASSTSTVPVVPLQGVTSYQTTGSTKQIVESGAGQGGVPELARGRDGGEVEDSKLDEKDTEIVAEDEREKKYLTGSKSEFFLWLVRSRNSCQGVERPRQQGPVSDHAIGGYSNSRHESINVTGMS